MGLINIILRTEPLTYENEATGSKLDQVLFHKAVTQIVT